MSSTTPRFPGRRSRRLSPLCAAGAIVCLLGATPLPAIVESPATAPRVLEVQAGCEDLKAALADLQSPVLPGPPGAAGAGGSALWVAVPAQPEGGEPWIVAMPSSRADALWSYAPPGYAAQRVDAGDRRTWDLSFRQLGREVRPTAVPSYLCFAGQALVAAEVEIAPAGSFRAADLAATGRRALAFGVIVAMGLFSLSFLVALRERVFAWYFGYLCVFLLYLAAETRAAQRLPLLSHFGPLAMVRLSGVAIDIASALAIFFALDFIQLRRRMPRLARALKAIAWMLLPLGAAHGIAHLAGQAGLVRATIHVSNLLVAAGGLGLLVGGILSTARGSRYAAFFLVGWTPLVIAASAASIQQFARSRTASATLDWMLFAGAFESVVLSLGLADRTLAYRRELDRARELADRDALSGLLNRRALLRLSEALAADSRRWGSTLSVVMFDLDHFKQVNDVRGHAAGDVCIQQFAEHLTSEARASDFVARYGGEEFAVILPGSTPGAALAFAERVRLRVETHPVDFEGAAIPLTVSAGVATGRSRDSVESLLAYADQALYRAKRGGRNRVDVWGPRAVAGA